MASCRRHFEEIYNENALRREIIFRDRLNPLDYLSDGQLIEKFRLSQDPIRFLIDLLQDRLAHPTFRSHVISSLYYLASGPFQRVVGDCYDLGISQSSVSRILRKFVGELNRKVNHFIKFPTTRVSILANQQAFYSTD